MEVLSCRNCFAGAASCVVPDRLHGRRPVIAICEVFSVILRSTKGRGHTCQLLRASSSMGGLQR